MIKCQARYKIDFPSHEIKSLDCVSHLLLEEKTMDKVVDGFFLTAAELEQREREAIKAEQDRIVKELTKDLNTSEDGSFWPCPHMSLAVVLQVVRSWKFESKKVGND